MGMRIVLSLAVLGAATIAATAAEAAVSNGTFRGQTTAKDPVGLTVSGSRVTNLYFESVHMKCTDEDEYDTLSGQYRMESKGRFRIRSNRKFTVKKSTHGGANSWSASGRFNSRGSSATGTLNLHARYDVENNLDPEGSITCESGKVKFTVTRR
jgi:hypothetical protein